MKLVELAKKILDPTTQRYIIVGLVNTVFGYSVMMFAYKILHLSYWTSSAANYFFGSILSFFLNKHYTFRSKEKTQGEVFRFIINIVVCWLLAYGTAKPATLYLLDNTSFPLDVKEHIAMLVGMVLFTVLNYVGQRFFTFKGKEAKISENSENKQN